MKNKILLLIIAAAVIVSGVFGYNKYKTKKIAKTEAEYQEFLKTYESQVVDLEKESSEAYFTAAISGRDEDYEKSAELDKKLTDIYLNKEFFEKLKAFKESGYITDPILKRELDIQYIAFMTSLSDKEKTDQMIAMQNDIEQKFNTYRVTDGGKQLSDNEVDEILKTSKNSARLKSVWQQSKEIGSLVSDDIVKLAKIRNAYARDLGFENYQQMSLTRSEQDPAEIEKLFNQLDAETKDIYREAKNEIDEALAKNYGIKVSELQPWHYQNRFFQEVPKIFDVDMDSPYKNKDVLAITKNYYEKLGLPIDEILEKSDLYEKPEKYQHAMCINIGREKDARVVANIQNDSYWMGTLLHEFGHGVYFLGVDQALPWELRSMHTLTTEAIAIMFEGMIYSPDWMKQNLNLDDKKISEISTGSLEYKRLNDLIFSRWTQVMYRFEKAMYENPDQDLNQLWWDLVEKYQLIKKPEGRNAPDWASKIHVATSPIYYHNYILGYLYASQLKHYINTNILNTDEKYPSYTGKKEVGEYLTKEVFRPGDRYDWETLIEKSTGEKLNPKYFAEELKKK